MKESVFIAIHCESQFYQNYDGISEAKKQTIIPLVIMMNRWDGKIGFIGGQVDPGEDVLTALVREVKEETGFELTSHHVSSIKKVSSSFYNENKISFFELSLNKNDFNLLLSQQHLAEHYLTEGHLMTVHFINYEHMPSFNNFIQNNFSATAKDEIYQLISHLNWSEKYNLI